MLVRNRPIIASYTLQSAVILKSGAVGPRSLSTIEGSFHRLVSPNKDQLIQLRRLRLELPTSSKWAIKLKPSDERYMVLEPLSLWRQEAYDCGLVPKDVIVA